MTRLSNPACSTLSRTHFYVVHLGIVTAKLARWRYPFPSSPHDDDTTT